MTSAVMDRDGALFRDTLTAVRWVDQLSTHGLTAYTLVLESLECAVEGTQEQDLLLTMARALQNNGARDFRPILQAAASGDREEVARLVISGVPVNFATPAAGTALDVAERRGDGAMISFLKEMGAIRRRLPAAAEREFLAAFESFHAADPDGAQQFLGAALAAVRTHSNPFLSQILVRAEERLGVQAEKLHNSAGNEFEECFGAAFDPDSCWEKFKQLLLASLEQLATSELAEDTWKAVTARRAYQRVLLHQVAKIGDVPWMERLLRDESDELDGLVLESVEVKRVGNGCLASLSLSTPAHAALSTGDPKIFAAMAAESRGKPGTGWGMLEGLLRRILKAAALPPSRSAAPEFERLVSLRRMVFSWEIPKSTVARERMRQRINRTWEAFGVSTPPILRQLPVSDDRNLLPKESIFQLADLAAIGHSALKRAVPNGRWRKGQSVREEALGAPGCLHLAVLFDTGLPMSAPVLLRAIGADLDRIADRVEEISREEFLTAADFQGVRVNLTQTVERLCIQARDLAADLPGSERFLKIGILTKSPLMRRWLCAIHRQIRNGQSGCALPSGHAWALQIRAFASECASGKIVRAA